MTYYKKQDLSRFHPERLFSLVIDEADQSSFDLSNFVANTKDERERPNKKRLIGILEHLIPNQL